MSDVARLGLAVDSSQVTTANTALDKFQASANAAAAGADKLQAATKTTGANVAVVAKSAQQADKAMQGVAKSTGLTRAEMINLSRQMQDVGVSLVSGQSPFMVLVQQGTQIADIFGSSKDATVGGALRQIGKGITGVLTPARLLVGGFGAVLAGGAIVAKWAANSAKQFDDVSHAIGATTTQLHGLQQAAAGKGIGQDDFFKGMQEFGANVYQAKNNMGALGTLFRANGVSAKGFSDSMEKAADLIKNAKDDQQRLVLLQQMGLPATMEWVRFMSQGAEGIRAATKAAVEFDSTAEGKLVKRAREFDEIWNKVWSNWVNNAKSAATQIVAAIDDVIQKGSKADFGKNIDFGEIASGNKTPGQDAIAAKGTFSERFGSFRSPSNADALQKALTPVTKTTIDPNVEITKLSRLQAQIGLLGNLATVEDQVKAKELELNIAALQGVGVSKQQADAIKNVVRAQAEMNRVQEQASIGVFDLAKALQAANDNLQALIARGLLDPKNAEQFAAATNAAAKSVEELADQAKVAGAALPQLQQAMNDATSGRKQLDSLMVEGMNVNRGFFVSFGQQIRQGTNAWDAFKSSGLDALGKIADKLMQITADKLVVSAFGGSTSGIAPLFGLGTGVTGSVDVGGYSMPTIGFANGGYTGAGGKYQPAGIVHKGEYVMDAVTVRRVGVANLDSLRGFADGGLVGNAMRAAIPARAATTIHTGDTHITIEGNADEKTVAMMRAELARDRASRYADTVKIVNDAKKKRDLR